MEKNSEKPPLALGIPRQMEFNIKEGSSKNEKNNKKLMVIK